MAEKKQNENNVKKASDKKERTLKLMEAKKRRSVAKVRLKAYKKEKRRLKKEEKRQAVAAKLNKKLNTEPTTAQKISMLAKNQRRPDSWLNLDNAALIFPAAENADISNMFRLSVLMKDPVDPIVLQQALNELIPRFPSMTSAVKRGLFWYYLEPSGKPLTIECQHDFPCRKIPVDSRHPLIRVTYYSHEISVEFFHSATDGTGGITFLNSLVAAYLRLSGKGEEDNENCLDTRDRPRAEELIDSFQTSFDKSVKGGNDSPQAYNYKMRRLPATALILVKGTAKADEINRIAKLYNATVGELLTAIYILSFAEAMKLYGKKGKKSIVISVPVNLRKLYPSKTLRNFVSMMSIAHRGGDTLEKIISECKDQFRAQYNREFFDKLVGYNVWGQHFFLIKIAPLPVKRLALKLLNLKYGDNVRTSTLSNLGRVSAPDYFKKHVLRYEFSLGPQIHESIDLTCVTFNNILTMTFTKTSSENDVERFFFSKLSELGAHIAIDANFDPEK